MLKNGVGGGKECGQQGAGEHHCLLLYDVSGDEMGGGLRHGVRPVGDDNAVTGICVHRAGDQLAVLR